MCICLRSSFSYLVMNCPYRPICLANHRIIGIFALKMKEFPLNYFVNFYISYSLLLSNILSKFLHIFIFNFQIGIRSTTDFKSICHFFVYQNTGVLSMTDNESNFAKCNSTGIYYDTCDKCPSDADCDSCPQSQRRKIPAWKYIR